MAKATLKTIGALLSVALVSGCASAGHHGSGTAPTEAGQGAFAAIAEVVILLEQNPDTDWAQVNIDSLREHLVDMNALTLGAQVSRRETDKSITFEVSGSGASRRAIDAMVPAHARQLAHSLHWKTEVVATDDGMALTLQADTPAQLQRFRALGFFGVMATGAHHQDHHYQMATGTSHGH